MTIETLISQLIASGVKAQTVRVERLEKPEESIMSWLRITNDFGMDPHA